MRYRGLKLIAVALLATACYAGPKAQQTGAPDAAPQAQLPEAPPRAHKQVHVYAAAGGAYLGVDPRDVSSDRAGALKLKESRGVEVMMVDRDSPAGKAGLKEHDVIVGFNGKPVTDSDQLRRMLRETQAGKTVPLAISRAGESMTLNITLTKRPEEMASVQSMFPMPPMPPMDIDIPAFQILQLSKRNGLMVEDLTPQLADFFGVKNGGGVLIRSVDRGSAADSAGLKAGDVIVKAGNDSISCSMDWGRIMRGRRGNVPLAVVRDKREQTVTLKLPERSPESSLHIGLPTDGLPSDLPELQEQMEHVRAEIERERPEIERAVEVARAEVQEQWGAHQRELEEAMKLRRQEIERAQREAKKALDQAFKDMNKQ